MHRIFIVAAACLAMALTGATAFGQKPAPKPNPTPTPAPGPYVAPITISPSANPVVYPSGVTFTGRVTGAKAGVTITLQKSILRDGPYVNVAAVQTDNAGKYSVGDRPTRNFYYRVVATGSATGVSPGVFVRNAMRVGLILSDTTPRRGQLVTFRGTVRPRHDGRTVYVQRRSSTGRWVTLRRPKLVGVNSTTSRYRARIRVRSNGVYRARVLGHSDHSLGTSRSRSIVVH